jgi:predicted RNA-binding protein with PIN domain
VRRAQAVCEKTGATAVVVFDPTSVTVDGSPHVSVRVAEKRRTADEIIRDLVDEAPDPRDLTVVTSDKPLYSYARTRGAQILRCHEWAALERGSSL